MILTSHRLDCFKLCMDSLLHTNSLTEFDHVVLMLNGVEGKHQAYVDNLIAQHSDVSWDTISGPRGKGERVANLQNECVRRYPDSLYFKMDEDLFVSPGWVQKLEAAYLAHCDDPDLALVTATIPNNAAGCHFLLTHFPELRSEYEAQFTHPVTTDYDGPVWLYPQVAEWMMRKFMNLDQANRLLNKRLEDPSQDRHIRFAYRFSINCLVYDYRHWTELGGIPKEEELAWGQWVPDHGKYNVLATDTLMQHYSFFVQQDWLDRTNLLEELRRVNVPATLPTKNLAHYHLPRMQRIAAQIPNALKRRLTTP